MILTDSQKDAIRAEIRSSLRTIVYLDDVYKVFVSRCLETGSTVTADTKEMAEQMMRELLDDEVSYALTRWSLANLFSTPSGLDIWSMWISAKNKGIHPETAPASEPQTMAEAK